MRSQTLPFLALLTSAFASDPLPPNLQLVSSPFQSANYILDSNPTNSSQTSRNESPSSSSSNQNSNDPVPELLRRAQGSCANGYNSCSTLAVAFANVCCATTAVCSADNVGNIACCPLGSFCTGTINPNTGSTLASNAASTTTTGGGGVIIVGATTTTASTTTGSTIALTTGTLSYVSNAYFPFPYIPSTFADQSSCISAYSACASNYLICSTDLAGAGAYGVTVVAPGGGGVTVAAATTAANLGATSASSICASLSTVACHGLQLTNCGVTATSTTTGFTVVSAGGRRTRGGGSWMLGEVGGLVGWSVVAVVVGLVAVAL